MAERLSVANRFTWQGGRYPRAALDHILLSEGLLPLIESVEVEGHGASDHRALVVELRLPGAAEPEPEQAELQRQQEEQRKVAERERMWDDGWTDPPRERSRGQQRQAMYEHPVGGGGGLSWNEFKSAHKGEGSKADWARGGSLNEAYHRQKGGAKAKAKTKAKGKAKGQAKGKARSDSRNTP